MESEEYQTTHYHGLVKKGLDWTNELISGKERDIIPINCSNLKQLSNSGLSFNSSTNIHLKENLSP